MTTDDDSTSLAVDSTHDRAAGHGSRAAFLALAVALVAGCTTSSGGGIRPASSPATVPAGASAPPSTRPAARPPFIARVVWMSGSPGRSLRVYPTPAGRVAALSGSPEAWSEVLRYAADAGTPGMQAQFDCHWIFARIVEPEKPSWDLEPWRPVVSPSEMQRSRCNPGGAEEDAPDASRSPTTISGGAT